MTRRSIFLSTTIAIAFAAAFVTIPAEAHGGGGGGGGGGSHSAAPAPQGPRVTANPTAHNTRPSALSAVSTRTGSSASIPPMTGARPIQPKDPSRNAGNRGQSPSRPLGLNDIVRRGGSYNSTIRAASEESTAGAHLKPGTLAYRVNTPLHQVLTTTGGKTNGTASTNNTNGPTTSGPAPKSTGGTSPAAPAPSQPPYGTPDGATHGFGASAPAAAPGPNQPPYGTPDGATHGFGASASAPGPNEPPYGTPDGATHGFGASAPAASPGPNQPPYGTPDGATHGFGANVPPA